MSTTLRRSMVSLLLVPMLTIPAFGECPWPDLQYECGNDCCYYDDEDTGCYGLDPGTVFGIVSQWNSPSDYDQIPQMNMTWVRLDLRWETIEAVKGVYNWSVAEDYVSMANVRNLRIVGLLHGTPAWASSNGKANGYPKNAEAVQHWRAFVSAIATKFPSIEHWEPWNEPNNSNFWVGSVNQYVTLILRPAAEEIKNVYQGNKIIAPTLSDSFGMTSFFQQMNASGGTQYVDIIGQNHYYSDSWNDLYTSWASRFAMYDSNGLSGKPVWIMETGLDTVSSGGEGRQADWIERLLYFSSFRSRITNTFVYRLKDTGGDHMGVLRSDGSPKAAVQRLQQVFDLRCAPRDYPW